MREELCVLQAARGAVLSDSFDPAKYGQVFNMTSVEVLNIVEDSIHMNIISKMCEKMFDAQIKCLFEQERRMLEQNENELVKFLPKDYRTTIWLHRNPNLSPIPVWV